MKNKKVIIISAALVAAIVIGIFGSVKLKGYLPYFFDKNGINQPDIIYTLTIEKTDFANEVARRLADEGIITSAARFLGYLNKKHPDFVWYNGTYELTADMTYAELCQKLSNPDTKLDYVKFTVPEGKTVTDIADIVEKSGLCTAEEFLKAADSYDYDFEFLKPLKERNQKLIAYKLEGYLFPATYEFRKDTVTPEEIVNEMLGAFDDYVTDDMITKAKDMGLDLNELISFASVIQAEAFSKESMKNISSVFWNRLGSNSMKRLQSDPTTKYARKLRDNFDGYSQAMFDAYDTYTCVGIPVGPINCPGTDVIEAALNPNTTDYYYFVTDSDGNFYYNKTLDQHNSTISKLKKSGKWG